MNDPYLPDNCNCGDCGYPACGDCDCDAFGDDECCTGSFGYEDEDGDDDDDDDEDEDEDEDENADGSRCARVLIQFITVVVILFVAAGLCVQYYVLAFPEPLED